jgi:hypothetical protein
LAICPKNANKSAPYWHFINRLKFFRPFKSHWIDSSSIGGDMIFVTVVNSAGEARQVRFMIESLRRLGGELSDTFVMIFRPVDSTADLPYLEHVDILPLEIEASCRQFPLADKVFACARAEALVGGQSGSLAWISQDCLFVNPPVLFELQDPFDAALRPVHLRNVVSLVGEPLDAYWSRVYACTGAAEAGYAVESFVDCQAIRPYFNTHCFSIRPSLGILQAWRECFQELIMDNSFQAGPCRDELHQVFLHQVVLSALITRSVPRERIRLLPPEYSYPLHLQAQLPPERRLQWLDSTVCTVYEEEALTAMEASGPLTAWLGTHQALIAG